MRATCTVDTFGGARKETYSSRSRVSRACILGTNPTLPRVTHMDWLCAYVICHHDLSKTIIGMLSALDKLPPHTGTVYRGIPHAIDMTPGAIYTESCFISTSTSYEIAKEFAGKDGTVLIIISQTSGKSIEHLSMHKYEKEVLFKPRTMFRNDFAIGNDLYCREIPSTPLTKEDVKAIFAKQNETVVSVAREDWRLWIWSCCRNGCCRTNDCGNGCRCCGGVRSDAQSRHAACAHCYTHPRHRGRWDGECVGEWASAIGAPAATAWFRDGEGPPTIGSIVGMSVCMDDIVCITVCDGWYG